MKTAGEFKTNLITSIMAALLFSSTLIFFGPSTIYQTNVLEFFSAYREIIFILIPVMLISTVLLAGILSLLKMRIYEKAVSILIMASILLWIQGSILKWDYGLLSGRDIDWQKKIILGVIDSGIWVVLLVFAIIKSSLVFRYAKKICLAFVLIQSISLGFLVIEAPRVEGRKYIIVDMHEMFTFSSTRNVIILILDTFQTDVFHEIVEEDDGQRTIFRDFTYFRNSLGGFPTTQGSVPLILTGRYYQNAEPYHRFVKTVFLADSLPKILKESGYRVHLYPFIHPIYLSSDIATNFVRRARWRRTVVKETAFICDITLFRCLPHFLKKYVWNNQNWFIKRIVENIFRSKSVRKKKSRGKLEIDPLIRTDLPFFSLMKEQTSVYKSTPTFKFYHLRGVHPPFELNRSCEIDKLEFTRQNYKNQAVCLLSKLKEFLDILKEKGVYENSMIFIIGDHGLGNWGIAHLNIELTGRYNQQTSRSKNLIKVKSAALPLFLVKPFNTSKQPEMGISDVPVSLADIPKTILSEIGIEKQIPGVSVFSLKESDIRRRRFLYHPGFRVQKPGYFGDLTEYIITGFSWIDQSWSEPHRIFTPEGVRKIEPNMNQ
jgi:hypothetical protein